MKKLPKAKGNPIYLQGDRVIAGIISNDPMKIESSFWNGFTWMYHFEGNEYVIGQEYLRLAPESTTLEERLK